MIRPPQTLLTNGLTDVNELQAASSHAECIDETTILWLPREEVLDDGERATAARTSPNREVEVAPSPREPSLSSNGMCNGKIHVQTSNQDATRSSGEKADSNCTPACGPRTPSTSSSASSGKSIASDGAAIAASPTGQLPKPPKSGQIDIRLLVRRREAGALIGKRGINIKRMRETFKSSSFNIPDTGNGPERVVCISLHDCFRSFEAILLEISELFLEKSPDAPANRRRHACAWSSAASGTGTASGPSQNDQAGQVELKLLINSAYAGVLIGMGGQSIRKLRNDSKAAVKIYEQCCPASDERVCAIKARPSVVVATVRLIYEILQASQTTIGTPLKAQKPYDGLNFDLSAVDKYGGFLPDDCGPLQLMQLTGAGGAAQGPRLNPATSRSQQAISHYLAPVVHFAPIPSQARLMSGVGLLSEPFGVRHPLRPEYPATDPFQAVLHDHLMSAAASPVRASVFGRVNQRLDEKCAGLGIHNCFTGSSQAQAYCPANGRSFPCRPAQAPRNQRFQPYGPAISGPPIAGSPHYVARLKHLQQQQQHFIHQHIVARLASPATLLYQQAAGQFAELTALNLLAQPEQQHCATLPPAAEPGARAYGGTRQKRYCLSPQQPQKPAHTQHHQLERKTPERKTVAVCGSSALSNLQQHESCPLQGGSPQPP